MLPTYLLYLLYPFVKLYSRVFDLSDAEEDQVFHELVDDDECRVVAFVLAMMLAWYVRSLLLEVADTWTSVYRQLRFYAVTPLSNRSALRRNLACGLVVACLVLGAVHERWSWTHCFGGVVLVIGGCCLLLRDHRVAVGAACAGATLVVGGNVVAETMAHAPVRVRGGKSPRQR